MSHTIRKRGQPLWKPGSCSNQVAGISPRRAAALLRAARRARRLLSMQRERGAEHNERGLASVDLPRFRGVRLLL